MEHRPNVGDLVIVRLPNDDEIECHIKAVSGDQVEISWPQDKDEGGWVADRGMMSRNDDGSWNALLPERSDDIHPRRRH